MRVILSLLLILMVSVTLADSRETIEQRIRPVGQVRVDGQSPQTEAPKAVAAKPEPSAKESKAKQIYNRHCIVCHETGLAGAPKFRSKDWDKLLKSKGLDGMVKQSMKGLNAMPPKGTCFSCTEADMRAAIEYMIKETP